ncbi:MAG: hypothetical protein JWO67_2273, partial [Streptosporangiaceae bacterium]|nr:hypothetical protein [Streptosporangiaceae bacterium]
VRNLLHGRPGREPAKRIRPETAAAILAVQPKVQDLWAGARVDATGTHRRLQALVALGHSQARLAARLGQTGPNFCRMMRASQVRAATARAVLDLYRELWLQPPPETTRYERNSASRARNFAEGHGWVLPAAWDDGAIDDPDARPAEGWKRSQRRTRGSAELAEEALDVMGQGHTREQAAERLGVSVAAIDKAFERTRGVAA